MPSNVPGVTSLMVARRRELSSMSVASATQRSRNGRGLRNTIKRRRGIARPGFLLCERRGTRTGRDIVMLSGKGHGRRAERRPMLGASNKLVERGSRWLRLTELSARPASDTSYTAAILSSGFICSLHEIPLSCRYR